MKRNDDKSTKELTEKKENLSDHQQSKQSSLHSVKKQQNITIKVQASSNDHEQGKKQVLAQKSKNNKDQNKKNQQKPGVNTQIKKQKSLEAKKQKLDQVKNSKQLKQKLLKISNAKTNTKLEDSQSNAKTIQIMQKSKENNSSPKTLRSDTDKIKLNQQKIINQTKLLAKTTTPQQLCIEVPFSKIQNERLRLYFVHLYQVIKSCPKKATFEDVKNLSQTINMTEWMLFCKNLGITERIKGRGQGVHFLSFLFKKYEDIERRMNYEKFSFAVRQIILQIANNQEHEPNRDLQIQSKQIGVNKENSNKNQSQNSGQQEKKDKINEIIEWLNLNDKKKHTKKLRQMGVMCSEQVYVLQKPTLKPNKTGLQTYEHHLKNKQQRNSVPSSLPSSFHQDQQEVIPIHSPAASTKKKLPKIYRTHQERKQSKLMHNLAIVNLNKVTPTQDTKDFLQKYIGYDDRYLKQYFNKQDNVKNGVMTRLENNQKNKSKSRAIRN